MNRLNKFFVVQVDTGKARDTGMAMVLILLLLELFLGGGDFLKFALPVLIINMIIPWFFYPFAYVWLGLANVLGTFVPKIILFTIYVLLVLPVGVARRLTGKDSLNLKKWKIGSESVFKTRNHTFTTSDIEKPY